MSEQFILKSMADGVEIPITGPLLVGRHPECGLLLPSGGSEGGPSRRHAQLSLEEGGLWVEDIGSKNGTFVNNTRVTVKTRLRSGDRLRFDRIEFEVQGPPEPEEETQLRMPQTQLRTPAAAASELAPKAVDATPPAPLPSPEAAAIPVAPAPKPAAVAAAVPQGPRAVPAAAPVSPSPAPAGAPASGSPAAKSDAAGPPARAGIGAAPASHAKPAVVFTPPMPPPRPGAAPEPASAAKPAVAPPPRPVAAASVSPGRAAAPATPASAAAVVEPRVPEAAPVAAPEPQRPKVAAAAAPPPADVPAAPVKAAVGSVQQQVVELPPGSWADPEAAGVQSKKTVFMDPKRAKEMLQQRPEGVGPEEVDKPTLTFLTGRLAGGRFELIVSDERGGSNEWTLGSDPDRDIVVPEDGVSGVHARIVNDGERWKIVDQLSVNGTFVNGNRTNSSFLGSGDELRLGPEVVCRFELPAHAAVRRPAAMQVFGSGPRIDLVTMLLAFLVTAALILFIWRFLLG